MKSRMIIFFALLILVATTVVGEDKPAGDGPMGFLADVMLEYLDANSDGAIDLGEYQAGFARGFGEMDTDNDGFLSEGELSNLGAMLSESKEGGGLVGQAAGLLLANWLKGMDADGDKRVSRDEFLKGCEKYFAKLDVNHDNKVTREELLSLPARILGK